LIATGTVRQRIVSEFREMPGLSLTVAEAARLWDLDTLETARILEQLERAGVLKRAARGTYHLRDG
jgi:DNA-binding IclR family transcriptional regulator